MYKLVLFTVTVLIISVLDIQARMDMGAVNTVPIDFKASTPLLGAMDKGAVGPGPATARKPSLPRNSDQIMRELYRERYEVPFWKR
ncbi:MAG: hypothetical protein V2B18_03645 [Pseudomonadota bacterium]